MKRTLSFFAASMIVIATASAKDNAIFLSKSAGYEHSAIKWDENNRNHVGNVLSSLADKIGVDFLLTKDASVINADNLKKYKLVIFYTTGMLTEEGTDKQPPMGANGVADLVEWINNGGGFMGYHCASDSFHAAPGAEPTLYTKTLGAEFRAHHKQFAGNIKVVDKSHPAMAHVPADWKVMDEWYLFKNINTGTMHVLAVLDPGTERGVQPAYNIPDYPIIWCSTLGKGRVYYNAMGHREDVWDSPVFQQTVVDAAQWAMGHGPADAEPNVTKVLSAEDLAKVQAEEKPAEKK